MSIMKSIYLSLLLLGVASTVIQASCPDEDLSACECIEEFSEDDIDVTLSCFGEEITLDQVKTDLNALDKSDRILVELSEIKLGTVPSNFFEGFKVVRLEISHCDLDSLAGGGGKALSGLEDTLEYLDIASSFTEENEDAKLDVSHLRKLTELDLAYNVITHMGDDWFQGGPPSLKRLVLSNNGIEKVDDNIFTNLNNLEYLAFDGNRFGPVKRSMLPSTAKALQDLELDNNAFTSVPEDLFSNMPALTMVSLRMNGLTQVPENTFKPLWKNLDVLDLRGNPIECDSHIDWISKVPTKGDVYGKCEAPHDKRDVDLEDLLLRE